MTKDGYEKTQILTRLRWLIKQYSDEAVWWSVVTKRCKFVTKHKTTMTKPEFMKVFGFQVNLPSFFGTVDFYSNFYTTATSTTNLMTHMKETRVLIDMSLQVLVT